MKFFPLAALVLAATALTAPAFATTFVGGQISADARASLGADPSPGDPQHADLPGVPNSLSLNSRFDTARGGDSIAVLGIINAFWTSAEAGSLNVHNAWGIDLPSQDITTAQVSAAPIAAGNPDWSYSFIADADGSFSMDYSVSTTGDVFGLGHWFALVTDNGVFGNSTVLAGLQDSPTITTGTFTQALLAGHTYTISLNSQDSVGFFGTAPGQHRLGADDDIFSWNITRNAAAVPEPSTWALAILGMGLTGAVLRRRRVAPSAA